MRAVIRARRAGLLTVLLMSTTFSTACASPPDRHQAPAAPGAVDRTARALLPAAIAARGTLTVAMDPTYPPDEFRQPDGALVGMDVDLVRAVAAKLGLKAVLDPMLFHKVLSAVQQGKDDLGVSSITDTTRREELGDFITYYDAGTSLMVPAGNPLTLLPDDESLCGHGVAAQEGTIEVDPVLTSRSAHCVADGLSPIRMVVVATEADARQAVLAQRADAMVEDVPVAAYESAHSAGRLQVVGAPIDPAPYGFALAKEDKAMDAAVLSAMQDLIDNGEYRAILARWGLNSGAVETATLDGAID